MAALIIGGIVAAVVCPAAGRLARLVGLVDHPGPLKVHREPVPYLGGAAVLLAALPWLAARHPAWLVPLAIALGVGIADDGWALPPRLRLGAEVVAGVAVAVAVDTTFVAPLHWALVVTATVVLVNGVNVLDGLDGLAGGTALAGLLGLALILEGDERVVALALAGAVAGFLLHNRPPARIYLGDGGSYLLGTALALLLAEGWSPSTTGAERLAVVLAVIVPVAELATAVVRRARDGRPLTAGDRRHTYDQLVGRGLTPARASLAVTAIAFVLAGLAVVAADRSSVAAGAAVAVALVSLVVGIATAGLARPAEP